MGSIRNFVLLFSMIGWQLVSAQLSPPEINSKWVQPSGNHPALPIWGHFEGIRVGIAPTSGPRGLLRIYTPYLGHKEDKMINFIAFEPIPSKEEYRGLSELEMSALDNVRGKRFWSSNDSLCTHPLSESEPAQGVIEKIDGVETLTVFIFSEPFDNGARVFVKLRFCESKPYELELTTYTCTDSEKLDYFILTATMGNFARLRTLHLSETKKSSLNLWTTYKDVHFTPHDITPANQMIKDKNDGAYFIAEPNEKDINNAVYSENTNEHWKYYGKKATQYWYSPNPHEDLVGLVNGRYTYWGSKSPIPGGVSFENFELKSPFKNGEIFIFGVTPLSAQKLIKQIKQ